MIYLKHKKGKILKSVYKDGEEISVSGKDLIKSFWELTERYPDELILWIDDEVNISISDKLEGVFHHDLIMASYSVSSQYIPDEIGYIDQLPFINPKNGVLYPTWRMSTDVGGIKGRVANRFKYLLGGILDFGYLINSISKLGQQNSLFCYSAPELVIEPNSETLKKVNGKKELFRFVGQHYNRIRLLILFFCFIKYEHKFLFWSLVAGLIQKSWFKEDIRLENIEVKSHISQLRENSVDVIIPTMGRPKHLENILNDLKNQRFLPSKVIIVEQDPEENSNTQLGFINETDWPFQIVHHFIHRTGACYARNLAMRNIEANHIFFADDDIRFSEDLLIKAVTELNRLGIGALNLNCILPGDKTVFSKIKQWGAFGSGTSVVRSEYALKCKFSELFEHGFGEDLDFGLQLRSKGCDVIYHPEITTIHLKAKEGGFRSVPKNQWIKEDLEPKPSPTMMILVRKYYSKQMKLGYKIELFLRFYRRQSIKKPLTYISSMKKRWQLSEKISGELLNKDSTL